ncbi:MAG: hypothetical protein AB1750_08430 [Chloroflexota bacterium]
MDPQILSALITGVFGAIVTPLAAQALIPRLVKSRGDAKPSSTSLYLRSGIGGVVGVLVGYFLIGGWIKSPCPPFSPTSVTIASPVEGASSARLITVQGSACHLENDEELWLLVVPEGVTAYYPQMGPIVISSDGTWSASAYLGLDDPIDSGKGFMLIVAIADQQGAAAIRTYFSQAEGDYRGLEPLPQGIKLAAQVRVVRK